MQVRSATRSDAIEGSAVLRRSITELCRADHGDDPQAIAAWIANKTPEEWLSWLEMPVSLFVAEDAGRILGVGLLDQDDTIRLNYVAPEARWRGVSKALVAHMESEARRRGLSRCRLESTRTARAFYEAAGYRHDDDPGEANAPCLRMVKSLEP
jgi:GNAT superfamily N-acetyltransferase